MNFTRPPAVCLLPAHRAGLLAIRHQAPASRLPPRLLEQFARLVFAPVPRVSFYRHVKFAMSLSRHLPARIFPSMPRALGTCLLGGLLVAAPLHAEETASNVRWVSDSLNTYVRSGPTDGYRIVGTLTSGQKVELLSTQGDYSQVRNENGNAVWIPSRDLQEVPGQAERLPQLEQKVAELTAELAGIDDTWKNRVKGMQETLDSRKKLIDELQTARSTLNLELSRARSELRELQAQIGDENQQVLMRYMVYGGSIAGAGLFAGLILPTLLRVRRKRNDQWF